MERESHRINSGNWKANDQGKQRSQRMYLFQRLPDALQRGDAVSFLNIFPEERESHLDL